MESNRKSRKFSVTASVIVVASLLAVYFLVVRPQLRIGRESLRRITCRSNLRSIGLQMLQYTTENDDVFPWGDSDSTSFYRYLGKLHPYYVSDLSLFTCPSSRDHPMDPADRGAKGSPFKGSECRKGLSYAYGHNQGKPWRVKDPSSVRVLADKYATQNYTSDPFPKGRPPNHWIGRPGIKIARHVLYLNRSPRSNTNPRQLEADYETQIGENSDPHDDQTGTDWFSDPPDK